LGELLPADVTESVNLNDSPFGIFANFLGFLGVSPLALVLLSFTRGRMLVAAI
jgi:hypothetical protein